MLESAIQRLIDTGETDGLKEKLDIFFLYNRLSEEKYKAFTEALQPTEVEG